VFGVVDLGGGALSTSGDYLRHAEGEGRHRRGMILDPRTGEPPAHEVLSATVLSQDGVVAEALSTAAVVLGPAGIAAVRDRLGGFEAVLVTPGAVLATPGLREAFLARRSDRDE
ncbi:MAG: FAD:protein FMN transferase, partial [Bifidobacteriaceae bacterium]|nr:FAD:protein FMN transferase [Bifidobacteriaceae bacterium]